VSEPPRPNVITIDGHAIEYRLQRRGDATALILHGGHMSARCQLGEKTFFENGYSVLVTSRPAMAEQPSALDHRHLSSPSVWQACVACWTWAT
jgi:hypothetical protein